MTADAPHRKRDLAADSTQHVFNRGLRKQTLFRCQEDYDEFLSILLRLLTPLDQQPRFDANRNPARSFHGELVVVAFALMPNHFHLVIHQYGDPTAISRFMHCLETAYAMYFNRKYNKRGKVYEGRFHNVPLPTANDIRNEIVYAHRNPDQPLRAGRLTSHELYMSNRDIRESHWCRADLGLKLFRSRADYVEHLHDMIMRRERDRERAELHRRPRGGGRRRAASQARPPDP